MEKKPPICVCIPCQDQCQTGFTFDLSALCGHWASRHPDRPLHLVAIKGSILPGQRQKIALQALQAKPSHMLWLDTDMRFPPDVLDRLLSHDADFVAANYVTRRGEIRPTAIGIYDDKLVYTTPESTGLEPVAVVGFGVALIKAHVFEKLTLPYFCVTWDPQDQRYCGEDAYFCLKCWIEANIRPQVDHELSKYVRHSGMIDWHHKHANPNAEVKIDEGF